MASEIKVDTIVNAGGDNDTGIDLATNDTIKLKIAGSEKARMDDGGDIIIGKTAQNNTAVGTVLQNDGFASFVRDGNMCFILNRLSSDGTIIDIRKDGSTVGSIGTLGDRVYLAVSGHGVCLDASGNSFLPTTDSGGNQDNFVDIGASSSRFDDIFATNGTIQTSDQNEKNTITDSDLGLDFVNRLAPKSYIFNGKTRTHYGLIAQDVETVLSDINKETSEFAGFIKSDISEEQDGSQYRYGLRYTEFVGILIKALQEADDKIDALTARVTALESE